MGNMGMEEAALVFDFSRVEIPLHAVIVGIADWCRDIEAELLVRIKAVAIILQKSLWSRSVWSWVWGILLAYPPSIPFSMVWDAAEAEDFIAKHLHTKEAS